MDEMLELTVKRNLNDYNIIYCWKVKENSTKEEVLKALDLFKDIIKDAPENYWRNMGA